MRKTDDEILEEISEGYAHAIRNGDLSLATIDPVERAYAENGEYMGAFVTLYAFVDDSEEEEEVPARDPEDDERRALYSGN